MAAPDIEKLWQNLVVKLTGLASNIALGTASSSAVTLNAEIGIVTTDAYTTAQNAIETVTVTNDRVAAGDIVLVEAWSGTNTQGTLMKGEVKPAAGSFTVKLINKHASSQAFNGTLKFGFLVIKADAVL